MRKIQALKGVYVTDVIGFRNVFRYYN